MCEQLHDVGCSFATALKCTTAAGIDSANDASTAAATQAIQCCHVLVQAALTGQTLRIECHSETRFRALKKDIELRWFIPSRQQRLIIRDTWPSDDALVLAVCGSHLREMFATISLVRVQVLDFQLGDKVVAVMDSYYLDWRKAGDEGTIEDFDAMSGELSVFWHHHQASSPFDASESTLDPYEMLRIVVADVPRFQIDDQVVAVEDGAKCSWQKAGDEGVVKQIDALGIVSVYWNKRGNTSKFSAAGEDQDALAHLRLVCKAQRTCLSTDDSRTPEHE